MYSYIICHNNLFCCLFHIYFADIKIVQQLHDYGNVFWVFFITLLTLDALEKAMWRVLYFDFLRLVQHYPKKINEPAHEIMVLITKVTSESSGEPAHFCSLTSAFAVRTHKVWK